ncbi:MAG: exodeoxyribonuclease V subunit alpha [Actinomycetes bacterium]
MSDPTQISLFDGPPPSGEAAPGAAGRATRPPAPATDPLAGDRVAEPPPALAPFCEAGVLAPADVHAAVALSRVHGLDPSAALPSTPDALVLLGLAFAVRGPRLDHVCLDLDHVRETVVLEDAGDLDALPWPDPDAWHEALAASPVATVVDVDDPDPDVPVGPDLTPLVVAGRRVYLDRYWRYERSIASLLGLRASAGGDVAPAAVRDRLDRILPPRPDGGSDRQRLAAATAALRRLTVLAGGPGTGKTTTVARLLVLLDELAEAEGLPLPRVALAAPTGKAAARMAESLREAADEVETSDAIRARLRTQEASTIHRLLGYAGPTRFRHHADAPLPHDVVVVDETSMVDVAVMAKLLAAVRPEARLVLVGDPEQLRSVEAGAVLGDVVGDATAGAGRTPAAAASLAAATGHDDLGVDPSAPPIADGIVVLDRVHRFDRDSAIADLAAAVQRGDAAGAVEVLRAAAPDEVRWVERPPGAQHDTDDALTDVAAVLRATGAVVLDAARAGDAAAALDALDDVRVLCAHRRGPFGVATWTPRVAGWIGLPLGGRDHPVGRPLLVTRNDPHLGLHNGDVGVVVATPGGGRAVAFPGASRQEVRRIPPSRLTDLEVVHAMTVHKAQGSQFTHTVVVLPDVSSPLLTRELLYTAVTRGRRRVTLVASEDAVVRAVERRLQRASGLREALWRDGPGA